MLTDRRFWIGVSVGLVLAVGGSLVAYQTAQEAPEDALEVCRDCEELTGCPVCVCWEGR